MPSSYDIVGGWGYDTRDFSKLQRELRLAQPKVAKDLRKKLRAAGEVVAEEARKRAGEHSQSIPPTISVRTAGARVVVRAGGPNVPIARLYERGNRGRGGQGRSTFRHPVWGNRDVWVEQPRYPFLAPAADAKYAEVMVELRRALGSLAQDIAKDFRRA